MKYWCLCLSAVLVMKEEMGTMVGDECIFLEEGRINEHVCHESREA